MAHGHPATKQDLRLIHREGAFGGALVAAGVVAVLAFLVLREWEPLLALDAAIEDPVHRWALQAPVAVSVSQVLSLLGDPLMSTVVTVIVLAALLLARRWWIALAFGLVATAAPFLTDVIKPLVDRARPEWAVPIVPVPPDASFPSGHATGGIAVWLATGIALATLLRTHTGKAWFVFPWILIGFSIGLSRIVLGVHWPSDVLAGWCVAAAVAGIATALLVLPSAQAPQPPRRGAPPPAKKAGGTVPRATKAAAADETPAPDPR